MDDKVNSLMYSHLLRKFRYKVEGRLHVLQMHWTTDCVTQGPANDSLLTKADQLYVLA